jgi:hypothetical protein
VIEVMLTTTVSNAIAGATSIAPPLMNYSTVVDMTSVPEAVNIADMGCSRRQSEKIVTSFTQITESG